MKPAAAGPLDRALMCAGLGRLSQGTLANSEHAQRYCGDLALRHMRGGVALWCWSSCPLVGQWASSPMATMTWTQGEYLAKM